MIMMMIIIIIMAGLRPIAAEFLAAPPAWPVGVVLVAGTVCLAILHHIMVFHCFSMFFDVFPNHHSGWVLVF